MKKWLLVLLIVPLLFLTSCTAVTGTIDFGFIKIPSFLILGAIVVYIIYKKNHK